MDGGQPAAALDEALERRLLAIVEYVARTVEEDDGAVAGQVLGREQRRRLPWRRRRSPLRPPSSRTAATPAAIASWRYAAVLEKTSTRGAAGSSPGRGDGEQGHEGDDRQGIHGQTRSGGSRLSRWVKARYVDAP